MNKIIITSIFVLTGLFSTAQTISDTAKNNPQLRKEFYTKKYGSVKGSIIANKDVKVGFTMKMVNDALGTPNDIKEEVNGNSTKVTFVYYSGGTADYYYFNGKRILPAGKSDSKIYVV